MWSLRCTPISLHVAPVHAVQLTFSTLPAVHWTAVLGGCLQLCNKGHAYAAAGRLYTTSRCLSTWSSTQTPSPLDGT